MFKKNKKPNDTPPRYALNRNLASSSYQPNARPPERAQPEPPKKRRFGFKKALLLLFVILLTPLLVIGFWDYQNASSASQKLFGTGNVAGALLPSPLAGSDTNRVNILVVGYSADDPGHEGANLTDSIMIVSLDKEDNTGYMLNVPRDLYVSIPAYGSAKINEAYQAGEQEGFSEAGYPDGGIGLLRKVVSDSFGVPLQYHVLVNYGAVRDTVNALDGVTVNVHSPDPRGLYDPNFKPEEGGPLTLANGQQEIDGQTALRLTRARGSTFGSYGFPQSDLNRTQNQQQVFAAIKNEVDWRLILDPRVNGQFFDALANNIETDLELSEVLPLLRLFNGVPEGSLQQVGLNDAKGTNLLESFQTRTGQAALVPAAGTRDFSDIQAFVESLDR